MLAASSSSPSPDMPHCRRLPSDEDDDEDEYDDDDGGCGTEERGSGTP